MVDLVERDTFWGDASEDMHRTAVQKAATFHQHPSAAHFKNAAKHFKKAADTYHAGGNDEDVVKHWDRGDKHMAKGEKMTLESEELDEVRKQARPKPKAEPQKKDSEMSAEEREKIRQRRLAFVNEDDVDEALIAKTVLRKYRAKAKTRFLNKKGGLNAALEKQDKEKKVEVRKEDIELDEISTDKADQYMKANLKSRGGNKETKRSEGFGKAFDKLTGRAKVKAVDPLRKEDIDEGDGPHSVEFYDARERKSKAKWHYDRTGKQKGASLSKGIKHDYEAELLRRGVKDSNGNQKPLRKEDVEQLDELSPKTLKSYVKKAGGYGNRSGWGLAQKGEKEEDKSMSTDGNKYPEKQERHQKAASKLYHKSNNRDKGVVKATQKLKKESIVDLLMVNDDIEASPYISEIEARCDAIVAEIKNEMKQSIFALEGHSINQLKQAANHHRLMRNVHDKAAESPSSRKYGTGDQFRMKAHKHNNARITAERVAAKMQATGVSHSSKLPKNPKISDDAKLHVNRGGK